MRWSSRPGGLGCAGRFSAVEGGADFARVEMALHLAFEPDSETRVLAECFTLPAARAGEDRRITL